MLTASQSVRGIANAILVLVAVAALDAAHAPFSGTLLTRPAVAAKAGPARPEACQAFDAVLATDDDKPGSSIWLRASSSNGKRGARTGVPPRAIGEAIEDQLRTTPVVLLGEIHDNPHHHRIQACFLALAARNGRPALLFEQITDDEGASLSEYLGRADADAAGIGPAVSWRKRGWPDWAMYAPIAHAALARGLPILPANAPRDDVRNVARSGRQGISEDRWQSLGLDQPLDDEDQAALVQELVDSHCGLMPASAFGGMAAAQRLRDAYMARSLARALKRHGRAVLIAGNGHVRSDRGVPWHLKHRLGDAEPFVVVLAESGPQGRMAVDYAPKSVRGTPAADLVLVTERAVREDPCAQMRARFKGKTSDTSDTEAGEMK